MITTTKFSNSCIPLNVTTVILLFVLSAITVLNCERILPNNSFWETQVPKLSVFLHTCILPEILGRWYTGKLDLTIESNLDPNGECYCQKRQMNLLLLVPIQDALFPNFNCLVWPFRRYLKLGTVQTAENFQNLNGKNQKSASDDKNKVLAVAIK